MSDTQHTPWPELAKQIDAVFADRDRLAALNAELVSALDAAVDFIKKHPADPDITEEQCDAYLRYLATNPEATLAKARGES